MATQPEYLLTAAEFLAIDFGELKAELDNGVIRMMAGGTARHAAVQTNIIFALRERLRGSGCKPYGSDIGVETQPGTVRYPDVSVYYGRSDGSNDAEKSFDDPKIVFEVLSHGTARTDLRVKLPEYQALRSVETIVFVDTGTERLRILQRMGRNGWTEQNDDEPVDVEIPSLGITIPHEEIFARGLIGAEAHAR